MEDAKKQNDEQELQEQPKKVWIKPELRILDLQSGGSPDAVEIGGYRLTS